jgi:hypothetical protein
MSATKAYDAGSRTGDGDARPPDRRMLRLFFFGTEAGQPGRGAHAWGAALRMSALLLVPCRTPPSRHEACMQRQHSQYKQHNATTNTVP